MGASECECVRDLDTVKTAIYQRAHEIAAVFLTLFFSTHRHTRTHRGTLHVHQNKANTLSSSFSEVYLLFILHAVYKIYGSGKIYIIQQLVSE